MAEDTILGVFERNRLSRRDFIGFCTTMAAALGLEAATLPRVVHAAETQPRPPVIWRHFQECTCCSESLIRSSHPVAADVILDMISLDYHETLMAASGSAAEAAAKATRDKYKGKYILCVEGSIPLANEAYCMIGGRSALDILREDAEGAAVIIAYGNCACWGCVQSAKPNPTGAKGIKDALPGKTVIQVPGCPPIAEVITAVIVHLVTFGVPPALDGKNRPLAYYGKRVHDTCVRRAYFDAGQFADSFNDDGYKQGWCLYKLGCKGPTTYNACAIVRWNGGTSYPIQAGHPCLGCASTDFWDEGPFYTKLAEVPGNSLVPNPDAVGKLVVGAAVAGAVAHAGFTAVRKGLHKGDAPAPDAPKSEEVK